MEALHYHGHRQRLRERFLKSGFAGFAEHEIVELLLTLCIPRGDVKPAAKALLDRFGTLPAILDAPFADLQQVAGIGEVAPVALRLIRETATLYLQQQAEAATVLASPDSLTLTKGQASTPSWSSSRTSSAATPPRPWRWK